MIAIGTRTNAHSSLTVAVPAALPLHMRGRIREVRDVFTNEDARGQGSARDLLQRVCTAADLSDTWLMVLVDDVDPLTRQRLAGFYAGMGFLPIQADPIIMIRQSINARVAA